MNYNELLAEYNRLLIENQQLKDEINCREVFNRV